jgi:hypothetical protein
MPAVRKALELVIRIDLSRLSGHPLTQLLYGAAQLLTAHGRRASRCESLLRPGLYWRRLLAALG